MNYKQSAEYILNRRKTDLAQADFLYENALSSSAELKNVDSEYKDLVWEKAKGNKVDKKALDACEKKRKKILEKLSITQDLLCPKPHCPICLDTAFHNGQFCDCVKSMAINNQNLIELKLHNFSQANFELYNKDNKDINKLIFDNVSSIGDLYPNNKKRTIVLYGATGTGKTFLASCMANKILSRGMSVTALTAFGFVNRVLKYHTTFNEEKLSHLTPLLDSDLLVIDDLGTESILKNVTLEYLYMVLSERINSGKLTLVTTNLSKDGILSRYGERIYSRLFDKSLGYSGYISGDDIRLK